VAVTALLVFGPLKKQKPFEGDAEHTPPVHRPFLAKWKAVGGADTLGQPTAEAGPHEEFETHTVQPFQNGVIYHVPGKGTWAIQIGVYNWWQEKGGAAAFLPAADPEWFSWGCRQPFHDRSSCITYWTRQTGRVVAVLGRILSVYEKSGGVNKLGLPLGKEQKVPGLDVHRMQRFARAVIYYVGEPRGAYVLHPEIYTRWQALGGARDSTPVNDVRPDGQGWSQVFAGKGFTREIYWSAAEGFREVRKATESKEEG
jgi:uncharacterized protein with LGFP repeats